MALRERAQGREIGEVYMHVGNGGLTVAVVDEGHGPTLLISFGFFGHDSTLRFHTDRQSIREVGEMLLAAADRESYSEDYCCKGRTQSVRDQEDACEWGDKGDLDEIQKGLDKSVPLEEIE